jgi:hypothetical protein
MMSLNRKIGMIDGMLFLIFWSISGMASATYWHGALPIIVFIIIPVSAFVAWRGAKSVEKIKNGKATNRTSAIEGGLCGLIATLVISVWSYSTQVYAAGSVFDDISPNSFEFFKRIAEAYIPIITVGTILGSIHGVLFFNLNKKNYKTIKMSWLTT